MICEKAENGVEHANYQKDKKSQSDISLVLHNAEIVFRWEKHIKNSRAVKRRYRQHIENGEGDVIMNAHNKKGYDDHITLHR